MAQNPTLGRIVHYTYPDGVTRPAIVVRDWSNGCVNLQVFLDGSNDDRDQNDGKPLERATWPTSVTASPAVDGGESGTVPAPCYWNWPPRA